MTTSFRTVEPNFPKNPLSYLDLENDFELFGSVGIEGFAGGPKYYYWNRLRDQAETIYEDLIKTHPGERRRPFEKKLSSKYPQIFNIFRSAAAIQNELRKRNARPNHPAKTDPGAKPSFCANGIPANPR